MPPCFQSATRWNTTFRLAAIQTAQRRWIALPILADAACAGLKLPQCQHFGVVASAVFGQCGVFVCGRAAQRPQNLQVALTHEPEPLIAIIHSPHPGVFLASRLLVRYSDSAPSPCFQVPPPTSRCGDTGRAGRRDRTEHETSRPLRCRIA